INQRTSALTENMTDAPGQAPHQVLTDAAVRGYEKARIGETSPGTIGIQHRHIGFDSKPPWRARALPIVSDSRARKPRRSPDGVAVDRGTIGIVHARRAVTATNMASDVEAGPTPRRRGRLPQEPRRIVRERIRCIEQRDRADGQNEKRTSHEEPPPSESRN